jgi:hypothetical protein
VSKLAEFDSVRRVALEKWETRRATDGNSIEPRLLEKPGDECRERPYRKPTLVAGCQSTKVDG